MQEKKTNRKKTNKIRIPPAPSFCVQKAQGAFEASIILCPNFGLKNNNANIIPKKITQMIDMAISDGDTTIIT